MSSVPSAIDRRHALKQRHHDALLDAAMALLEEHGGGRFSVDQLAERAEVSRRTVFNHFDSLDDVLGAAGARVLSPVVNDLVHTANRRMAAAEHTSMTEELLMFMRTADLVTPLSYLTRILGGTLHRDPWRVALLHQTLSASVVSIGDTLAERYPDEDRLRIDLLMAHLGAGLVTVHEHWFRATGAVDTPESRYVWDTMMSHLISTIDHGHALPPAPTTKG